MHRNCLMNRFCAPNAINFMFIATNISGWNFYNLPVSSGATRSVDEVLSHWASWANVEEKLQKCVGDFNPLNPELNLICCLLALLAHHFLHVSRIRVKSLTPRQLMSYIYGAPILDVSRSHTTAHHSREDSSGRVISSSQRPLPDNTRHSQQTNIHAPGGIRTHDLSRWAAALRKLSKGWREIAKMCGRF